MNVLNDINVGNEVKPLFTATKLWNQVLYSFYIGINPSKHRRHMRVHYNCFVATEAVDWLLKYLQNSTHFAGQQISRFQAINLLRKYLKTEVIERVDSRKANQEFQDNKELYRFTRHSNENLPFISTTNLNPNQIQHNSTPKTPKDVIQTQKLINDLTLTEKSDSFKQIYFKRFLTFVPNIDDFVRRDDIMSIIIMHNMTRISANGVVQLSDKSEDLPHWVMSAIKCLANWPKATGSGSCLPKYPGFENDVFAVVRDYFVNIGLPLIPNQLYPLVIHLFDKFSEPTNPLIINHLNSNPTLNPNPNKSVVSVIDKLKRQMSSTENLMKTSTPRLESQTQTTVELPPNHVFETMFMGDIPVTKIVSIDELTNLFVTNSRLKSSDSFRDSSNKYLVNKINEKSRYLQAITTIPRTGRRLQQNFKSPVNSNIYKTKYESPESSTSSPNSSRNGYHNFGFAMNSPTEDGQYMLNKSVSSLSTIHLNPNSPNDPKDNISAQFSKSSNNSQNSKTIVNKKDSKLLESLRLALLLMPPSNRRHLHLLLRLIHKMVENKKINLYFNENISTKDFILRTFTRSILCADREYIYDELKAQKIVSILVDNCKDVFKVPESLIQEIDEFLIEKIKKKHLAENSQQFCQRITSEEFELQRDVMSEYALADLLKSIMTNDSLSDRDKLKWIKQFKSYHPEVYDLYFTNQIKGSNDLLNKRHKKSMNTQNNNNLLKRFLSIRL